MRDINEATAEAHERAMVGLISRDALYDVTLAAYGITDATLRAAMAADHADITLYEGVPETLRGLRRRGH